ncbi:MAG: hypothetical protein WBW31_23755 [Candidatus Sulfotelmatobacter sp.]
MAEIDLVRTQAFAVQDKSILTYDPNEVTRKARESVDKVDAANRAMNPPDESVEWRNELDELTRRLSGYRTPEAWRNYSVEQEQLHNGNVKKISDDIAHVKSLLKLEGLELCKWRKAGQEPPDLIADSRGRTSGKQCGCDGCLFAMQIARLEDQLTEAKRLQQKSIRTCGAAIKNAEALAKFVPRYNELLARARKIDDARKSIRGINNTDLAPERTNSNEQLVHRLGLKSRHLKFD